MWYYIITERNKPIQTDRKDKTMKKYRVYVYNNEEKFHDCYEVNAKDPVDARNVAVQRLVEETGDGLNVYEITEVQKAD
jgi:hypothetical protein